MRINKYLSSCGFCSRREADRLIEDEKVFINGILAEMGAKVCKGDKVEVNGQKILHPLNHTYIAFYKPRGVVCTLSKKEKNNLYDYLKFDKYITYAGRLDKDSEGLLLLTDDGDLINRLMTGRYAHEKEYVVKVFGNIDNEKIEAMEKGLYLREIKRKTKPCKAFITDHDEFHIILTQGINRQIRRMCESVGLRVKELKRIRIENINLSGLKVGERRSLTTSEINELKKRAGF